MARHGIRVTHHEGAHRVIHWLFRSARRTVGTIKAGGVFAFKEPVGYVELQLMAQLVFARFPGILVCAVRRKMILFRPPGRIVLLHLMEVPEWRPLAEWGWREGEAFSNVGRIIWLMAPLNINPSRRRYFLVWNVVPIAPIIHVPSAQVPAIVCPATCLRSDDFGRNCLLPSFL